MASSTYAHISTTHDDDLNGSPQGSSQGSSTSPQNRFTPDIDTEDEDEGPYILSGTDGVDGYEMKELGVREKDNNADSRNTAHRSDEASDSDDEEDGAWIERPRRTSIQSFELYTPDEERAVRRKLDTHLVIFVSVLYLLSFLDRSNIGNAKIAGLTDDLAISDNQYEWLLTSFYITYILFEWMTVMYQLVPPHIYISVCVCAWGVLASLQCLATSYAYMLVMRALLGIGEAAFVGIPFYLTFFFRREELAFRTGLFISAAPLATSFASSLAWAIVKMGDKTGIASWRLLFLIEGFPAVLVAVACFYWLPDSPATARWLTSRQRKIATLRLRNENDGAGSIERKSSSAPRHKKKFQWREVLKTMLNLRSWLAAFMFFFCNVAFSSMPVFLPTIINAMGFDRESSQGLSAPPFLFAFVVVLLTAYLSDRYKSRSVPMIFHAFFAMCGYLTLVFAGVKRSNSHALRYVAVYPICAGFFSAVAIIITWTINNQASDEGKGTGIVVLNVVGQMGPLVGTRLYPDAEGPYYVKGMTVCAVSMGMVVILTFALRIVLSRENARMRGKRKEAEGEGLVGGSVEEKDFVYMI
jgi:MFS family permease